MKLAIYTNLTPDYLGLVSFLVIPCFQSFHSFHSFVRLFVYQSLPVCKLSERHPNLEAADFVDAAKHLNLDSKAAMLHGERPEIKVENCIDIDREVKGQGHTVAI